MLDRTTKTGPEKPSPQKLKTKGTHLLKFFTAFTLLESVGAASPTFEVVSGSCTVFSDKCVYSDNFKWCRGCREPSNYGQPYSDNQDCVIKQTVPFQLDVRSFDVENHETCLYDFLEVDGQRYCGTKGPQGRTPAAGSELVWHTDDSRTRPGFMICMADSTLTTISSAITCSGDTTYPGEVDWILVCTDGTTLSGPELYNSISPLAVVVGATCTLDMIDSYGDGWSDPVGSGIGAEWSAPGFGKSFSLPPHNDPDGSGNSGKTSFVVGAPNPTSEVTWSGEITCSNGNGAAWPEDVGWTLTCDDGTTLSGGAPYTSGSLSYAVAVGAMCTLDMKGSWGNGWSWAAWEAPGFGQSFYYNPLFLNMIDNDPNQWTRSFVVLSTPPGTSG